MSARTTPIRGIVVVRQCRDLLHRLDARRNDRCAAPLQAVHADAVHQIVIRRHPHTVRADRLLVLNLKNRSVGTTRSRGTAVAPRSVWESCRLSITQARTVSEDSRRKPQELI